MSSALVWPRPVDAPDRPWAFPAVATRRLANGLGVHACDLPGRALASVRLVLPLGATSDPAAAPGLAALTAKAIAEGTTAYDAVGLARALERLGASLNIQPTWDAAVVMLEVPTSRLEAALALLAEVVLAPAFPEAGVARLRAEQVDQLAQAEADPSSYAGQLLAAELFAGESRFALPLAGVAAAVRHLTRDDVAAHYTSLAVPTSVDLVIAGELGDIDESGGALEQVQRRLGAWSGLARTWPSSVASHEPAARRVVLVDRPGATQSAVALGRPTPPRTSGDYDPLMLGVTGVLGSFNGRLNFTLREEKGYTYGARGAVDLRRDGGLLQVGFTCRSDATGEAVGDAVAVLAAASSGGVTDPELVQARSMLVEAPPLQLESARAVATAITGLVSHGLGVDEFDRARSASARCAKHEVDRVAAQYLDPAGFVCVVVGDAALTRAGLDSAGAGSIDVRELGASALPTC